MNESLDEFQEKTLSENNCLVTVQWQSNDDNKKFINVNFAGLMNVVYFPTDKEEYGVLLISNRSIENHSELVGLPIYLIRLYILLDVFRICRKLNLSYNLIRFLNEKGERDNYINIFPRKYDNPENEKREFSIDVCTNKFLNSTEMELEDRLKILKGDDDNLEKFGLLHSFSILKGLLL